MEQTMQTDKGRFGVLSFYIMFTFIISLFFLQCDKNADKSEVSKPKDIKTGEEVKIGGVEFVYINGGSFMMGSPEREGDRNEHPRHKVTVDGFWISKYEVTQKLFQEIMGENYSRDKGDDKPAVMVSWKEAEDFCRYFSVKHNVTVRLPYESEWEYACRAGTETTYYWGDKMDNDYAWYDGNSGRKLHPVGKKKPNAWGLYDMSGNVYEWCMDQYGKDYYSRSPGSNPQGPEHGSRRIVRGGSWIRSTRHLRSAARANYIQTYKNSSLGFRLLRID